eukprot:CAMPEP_0178898030 /NCGR_PEP_ID=MMETSP0786-20121207/2095_1 /TAXON_ID=186022 /ORGANISM="Thalassionema frauenfeldii, Strain CCMP 1798" /LENGTH=2308 /DNA_ID=CAMNT_0020568685 /DNA_START=106 /DNA_END=7032 /DNA_ORIENTATION=-
MDEARSSAPLTEDLHPPALSSLTSTNENLTQILRKGDLVRIKKVNDSRLTRHDGALGRISKSIANDEGERNEKEYEISLEHHPYRYDVDLILGGKIPNCHRLDLQYTTAEAEGMTSEGLRKRKRTKTPESNADPETMKKPPNSARKEDKKQKHGDKKMNASTKKVASKSSKKRKSPTNAATKKKSNGKKTKKVKESTNAKPLENDSTIGKDLFSKHEKDFDRSFTRLEKMDRFGFFLEPPDNSDAKLASSQLKSGQNNVFPQQSCTSQSKTQTTKQISSRLDLPEETPLQSVKETPNFLSDESLCQTDPESKPPLTWDDLRARRNSGRYILHRLEKLEKERNKRLGPYKWDKRKRRQQLAKEGVNAGDGSKTGDMMPKPVSKPTAKRNLTRNGVRVHPRVLHEKGIHWDLFRADVCAMCNSAIRRDPLGASGGSGTLGHAATKVMQLMEQIFERIAKKHMREMEFADARHEFTILLEAKSNEEAAFQGNWRTTPFPERKYERLKNDVVCAGLSELDENIASCEKQTVLPDSFVGLSYTYNDTGESEGWMKSVTNKSHHRKSSTRQFSDEEKAADALSRDQGVIKAQVRATMQKLLIGVQDKVMTDAGVLKESELRSANWEQPSDSDDKKRCDNNSTWMEETVDPSISNDSNIDDDKSPHLVEQSVWGLDCYTRRNIMACVEKDLDPDTAVEFVEKWLLPAINVCPEDLAHDLVNAAKILEGLPLETSNADIKNQSSAKDASSANERWSNSLFGKALLMKMKNSAPVWLKAASFQLRRAIESLGHDFFRVHPKGHGSIVLSPLLKANTLVTFYRGEVYPSWRWGEKMDAIDITQDHIGLRPNLPDFYNMALERPQSDPKGYGLMIVDASRKAGHGSMLSHSCDPTCEVRVAALNGKLCLAMTTLRNVELGEELTFDYNAVTESLEEYRSAICLCGYNKCRGSFLHFATADCYQSVLNRNSPIAVRFANLVKGCNKKVMAEEDEKTLSTHGFGTAAFGAVSFSRNSPLPTATSSPLDGIENVPVWLRTYVCDVLRYIEYERRALPIALLCDDLNNNEEKQEENLSESACKTKKGSKSPRAKPENSFQYFIRINKEKFLAKLGKKAINKMKAVEIQQAIRKVGASEWRLLNSKQKEEWKQKAITHWKEECSNDGQLKELASKKKNENDLSKISFECADAEGSSAMEQRIQQVTQALSRIGRVLDRHRERKKDIHAPLSIMTDHEVVSWIWIDKQGLVASLLGTIKTEKCVGDDLYDSLLKVKRQYSKLEEFATKTNEFTISNLEARKLLTEALLALRVSLHEGVQELVKDYRQFELQKSRLKSKAWRNQLKEDAKGEVRAVLNGVIDKIIQQFESENPDTAAPRPSTVPLFVEEENKSGQPKLSSRLEHYNYRWKLEAIADILLLYARTSTFFKIVPYCALESTPVEVYARELGNKVPWSKIIKTDNSNNDNGSKSVEIVIDPKQSRKVYKENRRKDEKFCDPDEVVAKVNVQYTGDYVVSQLLQWFNGGIGHKPGLPEMAGCVVLPSIKAVIESTETCFGGKARKRTNYKSRVRPRLFDWLRDPRKRGSSFPDDLAKIFKAPELIRRGENLELFPLGSPVLDLLVMGDDTNINAVLVALDEDRLLGPSPNAIGGSTDTGLESKIDEAMPAQAVAHWVQCENPECLKWRRLPFYVDIDLLPEKFFCKDNEWNPAAQSCDAPEDEWDENDADLHNDGVNKESDVDMVAGKDKKAGVLADLAEPVIKLKFEIGERFDVLRTGKKNYCTGEVVDVDFQTPNSKVKFHFPKVKEKFDEWIDVPSERVACLFTKQIEKANKSISKEDKSAANLPLVSNEKQNSTTKSKKKTSDSTDAIATLLALRDSGVTDSSNDILRSTVKDCKTVETSDVRSSNKLVIEKENKPSSSQLHTNSDDTSSIFIQSNESKNKNMKNKAHVSTLNENTPVREVGERSKFPSQKSTNMNNEEPQVSPERIPRKRNAHVPSKETQRILLNNQKSVDVRSKSKVETERIDQCYMNLVHHASAKETKLHLQGGEKFESSRNGVLSEPFQIGKIRKFSTVGEELNSKQVASMNLSNERYMPQNKCHEKIYRMRDDGSIPKEKIREKARESSLSKKYALLDRDHDDGQREDRAEDARSPRHKHHNRAFGNSSPYGKGGRAQSSYPKVACTQSSIQRKGYNEYSSSHQFSPRRRSCEDHPKTGPTSLFSQNSYPGREVETLYQSQLRQQQNYIQNQSRYPQDFYIQHLQNNLATENHYPYSYDDHRNNVSHPVYGDDRQNSLDINSNSGHEPIQPKPNAQGLHPLLGSRFIPKQK